MAFDSYIRVSQVKGRKGDSYTTVDEQRRKIAETAEAKGVTLGIEVVEEDVSGSTKATARDLNLLLERVERGESEGIIVAYQDRLSRGNLLEQATVWERLQKAGARFIAGDGIDSAFPGSELLFTIKAALAREEWNRHHENWETLSVTPSSAASIPVVPRVWATTAIPKLGGLSSTRLRPCSWSDSLSGAAMV
jgi:DNA invertase Pin-like site-specific DNA recombinase